MTERVSVAAADRASTAGSDTPVVLRAAEVIPMTPAEEDRLYRMLGRLIASALSPEPGVAGPPRQEAAARLPEAASGA